MRLQCLVWLAFSFFTAMRECTCDPKPRLLAEDGSVTISECGGQYYKLDGGCKELNQTPYEDYQDRYLIGKDGPDVEGTYCCENTCSSNCTDYSSFNSFIEVSETNISLNASAGQNFILDVMAYVTIGTVSMKELTYVNFEVVASTGTKLDEYTCYFGDSNPCTDNNHSINKTTYELNIFRIDPNNPTFYIRTTFGKHDVSEEDSSDNSGPTFYITVRPVVTLSSDNASDNFTCSVETSLPATLRVLVNGSEETEMNITSTSFNHTISSSNLSEGEHRLTCEVTSRPPGVGTLTSSQSEPFIVPAASTSAPPGPSVSSSLPTSITTSSPIATPSPITISSPIATAVVIGVTGGVIAVLILVLIVAVLILLVRKPRHRSSTASSV